MIKIEKRHLCYQNLKEGGEGRVEESGEKAGKWEKCGLPWYANTAEIHKKCSTPDRQII